MKYSNKGKFKKYLSMILSLVMIIAVILPTNVVRGAIYTVEITNSTQIEAENFLNMSGVQTEYCSEGGSNIGWLDAGDWVNYKVNVLKAGKYKVEYRVASQSGGGVISLEQNSGNTKLGTVNVPSTGGWQNWTTVSHEVDLKAGEQDIAIAIAKGGYNINWVKFTLVNNDVVIPPTAIEVKDGTVIEAENYTSMYGILTENCVEGGKNLAWLDEGDWTSYKVKVLEAGKYKVEYRVATAMSGGAINLMQGTSILGNVGVNNTGSWQGWTTVSNEVTLSAGEQDLVLKFVNGAFNVNWIKFNKVTSDGGNTTPTEPIKVEAENYIWMNGIQLESCTEGGKNVGYLDAGDILKYNINIPQDGRYKMEYRVASMNGRGSFKLDIDNGSTVLGTVNIPSTGGWQKWITVSNEVNLKAGSKEFGLVVLAGGFNINWLQLTRIGDETEDNGGYNAISPWDMVKRMGKGINMGNTLEAPSEGTWAKSAQEYYFDDYKAQGYTNVRIPINWGNHIDAQGNIDPKFLDRVEEVIDWSLERDLVTIINAHHEGWLIENYWGNKDKIVKIWGQVADRFKDKSENLVFELFNEPRDAMGTNECNDLNSTLINTIRPTNPTRILIIGGTGWGNYVDLMRINIPNDPYLMAQFHYYNPISFTHEADYTFSDYNKLRSEIATVTNWAKNNNIALYCGEFGVMHSGQYAKDWNAVLQYYKVVKEACVSNNIAYSVWDDEGWFGIYNRTNRTFNEINTWLK